MSRKLIAGMTAMAAFWAGSAWAQERADERADMRGLTVMVGGGVEGYTNSLAADIELGAAYGATVALKPSRVLGVEVGYTGAVHDFDQDVPAQAAETGPDIVRNGAHAAATIGLTATPLQPYVMAGLGVSRYNIRGAAAGFDDDTVGNVPLGAGLRFHVGDFTADARVNYNFLFDQEFAAAPVADIDLPGERTFSEGGRYMGSLNIGATW